MPSSVDSCGGIPDYEGQQRERNRDWKPTIRFDGGRTTTVMYDFVLSPDPANGDMILVYRTEDASGGRSFRLSPELGAQFRSFISRVVREKAN